MPDPFGTLGLTPRASADDVRSRRRVLAKEHHPDTGGDASRMRAVNEAAAAALRLIADRSAAETTAEPGPAESGSDTTNDEGRNWPGLTRDMPSFTVEALPVETFEALIIVANWMGKVLDDDPPYRLDTHIYEPAECWCRLELVPDAGASTVSISVASPDGSPVPSVELVRDQWVAHLNQLEWDDATR